MCIIQLNTRERNHQVQLMRQIYTRATKVLIWLGEEHPIPVMLSPRMACRIAAAQAAVEKSLCLEEISESILQAAAQGFLFFERPYFPQRPYDGVRPFTADNTRTLRPLFECT